MTLAEEYESLTAAAAAWSPSAVGQFEVSGPDAHAWVNRVTTVDISALPPGRFAHALCLRSDASILARVTVNRLDDLIVLLVEEPVRDELWQYFVANKRGNIRLRDVSDEVAVMVIRGPAAADRVGHLLTPVPARPGDLATARLAGTGVFAARTTSDGPDGIDLYCRARDRAAVEASLAELAIPVVADATWEVARLEWGVARAGIEIDTDDTPVEAGLERLVATHKGASFPGEVAFAERVRTGALKKLVGFVVVDGADNIPSVGAPVAVNGRVVDRVRSVAASPRYGIIGMTAVPIGADAAGSELTIGDGAASLSARVATPPFTERVIAEPGR